ncbi:30S ribosomal protein S16 [Candidatus Parcubacteria bacterium]|nr:30S ribosomal protein S16 [Candidatus Parcubacteria bacterium]
MLKIRLQRVGRRHEPAFRLVLTEHANSSKSGRFKELLGSYDPRKKGEALKAERLKHWLSKGATPTPTVQNLLVRKGVIRGKKVHVAGAMAGAVPATEEVKNDTIEAVETPADVSPTE